MIGKVAFEYNLPVSWRKLHAYYTVKELCARLKTEDSVGGKKIQARLQKMSVLCWVRSTLGNWICKQIKS